MRFKPLIIIFLIFNCYISIADANISEIEISWPNIKIHELNLTDTEDIRIIRYSKQGLIIAIYPIQKSEIRNNFSHVTTPINLENGDYLKVKINFNPEITDITTHRTVRAKVFDTEFIITQGDGGSYKLSSNYYGSHTLASLDAKENKLNLKIDLEFLDVTGFWKIFSNNSNINYDYTDYYQALFKEDKWKNLKVLAYTKAKGPLFWFVNIPKKLYRSSVSKDSKIGSLVFYRTLNYDYKGFTDLNHIKVGMSKHVYYTMSPLRSLIDEERANSSDHLAKQEAFRLLSEISNQFEFIDYNKINSPKAGFQKSIDEANLPLLLITPWDNPRSINSNSATSGLKNITNKITNFLASNHLIKTRRNYSTGRLGIMGYSYGGEKLYQSFMNNNQEIDEVYMFDTISQRGLKGVLPTDFVRKVILWSKNNENKRLGLIAGLSDCFTSYKYLKKNIDSLKLDNGMSIYSHPASLADYEVSKNQWFDYAINNAPSLNPVELAWLRHWFIIFGGPDKNKENGGLSFFDLLLKNSKF